MKLFHWRDVPHELADLLEQCTEEDHTKRPQSFQDVLTVLESLSPEKQEARRRQQEAEAERERQRQEQLRQEQLRREAEERQKLESQKQQNFQRWQTSNQAMAWVTQHQGQWTHQDWVGLWDSLKRSQFWPIDEAAVGQELERVKTEFLHKQQAERLAQREKQRQADEERERQAEQERQRQLAEQQKRREEGERQLPGLIRQILDRTNNNPSNEDNQNVARFIKDHDISSQTAKQILSDVREQWKRDNPPKPTTPQLQSFPLSTSEAQDYQKRWAEYYDVPVFTENSLGMKFAFIPPGIFQMGSPLEEEGREPYEGADETQHRVTLTKGFYMGVTQVTLERFTRFVNVTGYKTEAETDGGAYYWTGSEWKKDPERNWRNPGFEQTNDHPVTCVSWNDTQAFLKWLSQQDSQNRQYQLPSEAQWEYSCRAGTVTAWQWGNKIEDGLGWCNIADQSAKKVFTNWIVAPWDDGYVYTSPVGVFRANSWGLYDMHGNVWEWCQDWYGAYPNGDIKDPQGAQNGSYRVLRGGSCLPPVLCRSACRLWNDPVYRFNDLGCRVCFRLD